MSPRRVRSVSLVAAATVLFLPIAHAALAQNAPGQPRAAPPLTVAPPVTRPVLRTVAPPLVSQMRSVVEIGPRQAGPFDVPTSMNSSRRQRRFGMPLFFPGFYQAGPDYSVSAKRTPPATGRLDLQTKPGTAHVSADGYYVGTVNDFAIAGLDLNAGPHRIEIGAPGYQTLTFDMRIVADQTVSYRGDLEPMAAKPVPAPVIPVPPAQPKAFYVIPKCYAGDVPPNGRALPEGCDTRQMRIVPAKIEPRRGSR